VPALSGVIESSAVPHWPSPPRSIRAIRVEPDVVWTAIAPPDGEKTGVRAAWARRVPFESLSWPISTRGWPPSLTS
jgi:hypothetical protein